MYTNQTLEKKLVIVSGTGGVIGKTYFDYFVNKENTICQSIGRKKGMNKYHISLDLLDKEQCAETVQKTDLSNIKDVIYIHSVGIDKFEEDGKPEIDKDKDGIDDEVYKSNVQTFYNFAKPLIKKITEYEKPITICTIGSLSDSFNVPLWQSFSKSKNILRQYLRTQTSSLVRSVVCNVSSTGNEKYARIFADMTYWLKAEELCERSSQFLEKEQSIKYIEIDVFNHNPNYTEDYFTNIPKLLSIWKKDMGYKENETVPKGTRI